MRLPMAAGPGGAVDILDVAAVAGADGLVLAVEALPLGHLEEGGQTCAQTSA